MASIFSQSRAQFVDQVLDGLFDQKDGVKATIRITGENKGDHEGYLTVNWKDGHHEIDFKSDAGNLTLYSHDYNNLTPHVLVAVRVL